ncbi:Hypothetical protein CINCED_3A013161 [Cinara cedri]|uniref:Uncharacterized protein n=1 Tax=Cinara cedri TaxID=506608 RepID=A0A5E4MN60_9HEMI|nr:Hypothetical protein CINCED_3A013161 [Cinara cedri]
MVISKRIGASALVLMTCLCFTAQCLEILKTYTTYRTKLVFLSTMLKQESLWKYVFKQSVYYEFDKNFYREIIEKDIMKGAIETEIIRRTIPIEENDGAENVLVHEVLPVDPIKPKYILRNLFIKWYRVGTLLSSVFQIMQLSFKCLAYKHFSILLTLIRVEISRSNPQNRAAHWSLKVKAIVADIMMKMAALQLSDGVFLRMAKFFNIYDKGLDKIIELKFSYIQNLDDLITVMMKFICRHCHRFIHTDADIKISGMTEIAKELDVVLHPGLFNPSESKHIDEATFKEMFNSSMNRITEQFAGLPSTIGMTKFHWNSFLHFDKNIDIDGDDDAYYSKIKS